MANPFIAMNVDDTLNASTVEELPLLEEFAWDFENNHFLYDVYGNYKTVIKNEALKVWIYKCLKTQRYRYPIYVHGQFVERCNYGVDLEQYIGVRPNNEKTATLIKREIREALIANPYITSVDYIEVHELKHEKLTLNVGITSIYGSLEVENITI